MDGTINKAGAVFPTHSLASVTDFQAQSDMLQGASPLYQVPASQH